MSGALNGLRVIDFGQYIAGPLTGMLLADQGAEVIKIDPPGGPRWETTANAMWNRGKRSITLDLKNSSDLQIALQLVGTADVVIENFRPGVMKRLGLDSDELTRKHPHLIWCSIPGFAADDPRAATPAWEGLVGAATGYYSLSFQALRDDAGRGLPRTPNDRPIYSAIPLPSVYGASFAALSIAMALVARQRDGRGQIIEIPLNDAMFCAIGAPRWAGIPGTPWMRSYQCADGRWVDMLAYHAKFIRAFLKAAGVESWLTEPFIGNINRTFKQDPVQASALVEKLEALFRTRTAQDWETLMEAAGAPLAICRTTQEWIALPQAIASGAIVDIFDPNLGLVRQPGVQVNLSETPGGIAGGAPRPDQHRAEILEELRTLPPRSMPLSPAPDRRAPLAGLRVVDLGTVLVGPACGRTLAEFGADVIKVDDPKGLGPGIDVGRGKRSLLLDLRPAEGREVLDRLIESSDIVLQNFRYGVAEKMGIGYEQLRAKKPGLIYIAYSLYGRKSPWAARPGYDNQAQAATGMMERFGDGRPAIEALTVNDYGTALIGSFGVALAIYHQNRLKSEGRPAIGQMVDSALVYTASMLQAPFLCDHPGVIHDEPRGQAALGSGALHRNYRAADGWMFLAAHPAQLDSMNDVEGLSGISSQKPGTLQGFLEERLSSAAVSEWSKRLAAVDVAVHATLNIAQVMSLPYSRSRNLLLERPHPDGGTVTTIGPIPRLSHTPVQAGRPLRPSLDATEVLTEIGFADRIERLIQDGVVVIRPPKI